MACGWRTSQVATRQAVGCYCPGMRISAMNFFMFVGLGVVVGLVVGLVLSVVDGGLHPVVTAMIAGACTGIAALFAPRASGS